jgi:hypothetical protein
MSSIPQQPNPTDNDADRSPHQACSAPKPALRGKRTARRALGLCALAGVGVLALLGSGCGSTATKLANAASASGAKAVTLAVTSPSDGSVTSAGQVTVRGTVSPANAVVQIQGRPAAVGNGVFTGSATLHGGTTTIDVIGSAPGATPGSASLSVAHPAPRASRPAAHSASSTATPSVAQASSDYSEESQCGGGLSVGPNTTCAFAEDVRTAYEENGPGTVIAYSPVTNRSYAMSCSSGATVECTGGNDASVYFADDSYGSGYEPAHPYPEYTTPAVAHADNYGGDSNCGDGLSVGPNTTCAFAENVRSAYDAEGPGSVTAYSPVTNRSYVMSCSAGSPVECTGANDASVYFP